MGGRLLAGPSPSLRTQRAGGTCLCKSLLGPPSGALQPSCALGCRKGQAGDAQQAPRRLWLAHRGGGPEAALPPAAGMWPGLRVQSGISQEPEPGFTPPPAPLRSSHRSHSCPKPWRWARAVPQAGEQAERSTIQMQVPAQTWGTLKGSLGSLGSPSFSSVCGLLPAKMWPHSLSGCKSSCVSCSQGEVVPI